MDKVDDMMRRAVAGGVFPGAVLLASKRGEIRFFNAYGQADLFSGRAMTRDTFFDLASMTKPLATALAVLCLVRDRRLFLEQPIGDLLDDFRHTEKARITVADLLAHRSGLPAWRPYYVKLRRMAPGQRKTTLRQYLGREPLAHFPGLQTVYSDLGFMVLEWLIETAAGMGMDRFVAMRLYGPLGVESLFFPGLAPWPADRAAAATELCPWRGRLLCGQVHDDNAWATGGVAGHAGLFGTARAVHALLCRLDHAWHGRGEGAVLPPDLVRRFFSPRTPGQRPLGFDAPAAQGSAAGARFGPESVGHLGYTGTSFWMDPARSIHVVLLTNRVHPTRYNNRIRSFRPVLHDAVMDGLQAFGK